MQREVRWIEISERETKRRKKIMRETKRRKKKRKRKRKEKTACSSFDLRHSDDRNSSDQEVKSVYSTRAMLQEVGILPPLVYFHPKACLVGFL